MKPFLRVAMLALAVAALFVASRHVDADTVRAWQEKTPYLPFFGALALLTLVGVPATPFYLVAGAAYGVLPALAGTAAALALHLLLAHRIAATGLRPVLERWLARTRYNLPDENTAKGLRFAILIRLVPALPWFLKNYLLCLAGLPFTTYFTVSMASSMLYATPLIILGESAFERDLWEVVGWMAVLVLLLLAARFAARRLPEAAKPEKSDSATLGL
jgi:uncharacterized membrane protein YdjX (TVP38/TMEM64 family)